MYAKILAERDRRISSGETPDPICALAARIELGLEPSPEECAFVMEAHEQGPWRIRTDEELELFAALCNECGEPLKRSSFMNLYGIRVYIEDFGDCVMTESSR